MAPRRQLRAARMVWVRAVSLRQAVRARLAARWRQSEGRDCRRENRSADRSRSRACRVLRQNPAAAPAGQRSSPTRGSQAARPAGDAGRPVRKFASQRLHCRPRRTRRRRQDWPTGFACRLMTTTRRAGSSPYRPPIADRLKPATEIPQSSSQLLDRPGLGIGCQNAGSPLGIVSIASGERQVHGRAGPAGAKAGITLTRRAEPLSRSRRCCKRPPEVHDGKLWTYVMPARPFGDTRKFAGQRKRSRP
jgi:hypothetical protein